MHSGRAAGRVGDAVGAIAFRAVVARDRCRASCNEGAPGCSGQHGVASHSRTSMVLLRAGGRIHHGVGGIAPRCRQVSFRIVWKLTCLRCGRAGGRASRRSSDRTPQEFGRAKEVCGPQALGALSRRACRTPLASAGVAVGPRPPRHASGVGPRDRGSAADAGERAGADAVRVDDAGAVVRDAVALPAACVCRGVSTMILASSFLGA